MDYKISREKVVNLVLDVVQNYCLENDMPVAISHGEELKLNSAINKGSEFSFYLPVAKSR